MSRTIRRKNFKQTRNNSWNCQAFKVNGHFTTWDWSKERINGHKGEKVFRPMTKEEVFHEMKFFHGESSNHNARSPGPSYRKERKNHANTHNDKELRRWMNSLGEYDPVFMENPVNCWWDWS